MPDKKDTAGNENKEGLTVDIEGNLILDGNGNPIPLHLWENNPTDKSYDLVQAITDEEIEEEIERLELFEAKDPNEGFTDDLNGNLILDADGDKIPLEKWENSPSDAMYEVVQNIPEEEIVKLMKELDI